MAQKVVGLIKLQIPGGQATPAPPVGPALGQHGVNIVEFTKQFNDRTRANMGTIIPVVITVYADRSFTFITKTPPAAVLIKKECGLETASGEPNKRTASVCGNTIAGISASQSVFVRNLPQRIVSRSRCSAAGAHPIKEKCSDLKSPRQFTESSALLW